MKKLHYSRIGLSVALAGGFLLGCQIARGDFVWGEPEPVAGVNSASADISPSITADGLELYFASNRGHGADVCYCDIWVATRASTDEPWETPRNLGAPVNRPYGADVNPCISADGLELYFSDTWPTFIQGCAFRPGGYGSGDIWVSKRETREANWGTPTNLGPTVNSADHDGTPHLSTDGLSLYFSSNRSPGNGGDFYVSTRLTKDDPWGPAVDLGAPINTMAALDYLFYPFLSYDGLSLFFAAVPWPWAGNTVAINGDIFLSTRPSRDDSWGIPYRLPVLSSGRNDWGVTFASGDSVVYLQRSDPLDLGPGPAQATSDLWQVEVTPIMDLNGDGAIDKSDLTELQDNIGNTDNSLYDIAPMPLGDGIANDKDWIVLREYLFPLLATSPYPGIKAKDIPSDAVLSWESGPFAQAHDVYFGSDYNDVNDATTTDSAYMGSEQTNSYDPGRLDFGKTYYWRVDEINGPPDFTVFRGDTWGFTVEPFGTPIANITATASSEISGAEASKTIDGSGLNGLDQHSIEAADMWLSAPGAKPWIQYEFDGTYNVHEMWVWNSNQLIEPFVGVGAKNVAIEYSTDGAVWTPLEGVPQFAQATGTADYTHNTTVDLGGVLARFVRITVNSGWGMMPQYGLSEVRFFSIPVQAEEPQPATDDTADSVNVVLKWRAGYEAVSHEISLSTDSSAVADGTAVVATTNESSFDPGVLNYGTTYYWKVDEVNEAGTPTIYVGDLWSFTTPDFGIIDNFEHYDDNCNRIFFAWKDGLGHIGGDGIKDCNVPPSDGNGGGSVVGYNQAPFVEKTIVNVDSQQSLPLEYDNAFGPSETTLTLAGQDWTTSGVKTLSLFFYGQPGNSGQLYVKINNTKVIYNGDGADLTQEQWQQWNIDLTSLASLQNVTRLTIGADGVSAAGMLYIDDIRLYP